MIGKLREEERRQRAIADSSEKRRKEHVAMDGEREEKGQREKKM